MLLVETKRRIGSANDLKVAVEQAESYAGKLRCSRFAIAAPEGFWVFELKFPGQSEECAFVKLDSESSTVDVGRLNPLISYTALGGVV